MFKHQMIVSQKVGTGSSAKHQEIGRVEITVPTIADVLAALQAATVTGHDEATGCPLYGDNKIAAFVQDALFTVAKGTARNRLLPKSAAVKPGLSLPVTMDDYTAEVESNRGEALAILRDAKADFAAWIATIGLSDKAVATPIMLFGNKQALMTQGEKAKAKFAQLLEAFGATLDEAKMARYDRHLSSLTEALATDADEWTT